MTRSPHRDAPYWVHSDPNPPDEPPSDNDPCPGTCNARWRQATNLNPHQDDIHPVPGAPIWCRDDQDRIRTALGTLVNSAAATWTRTDGRLNTGKQATDTSRHGTRTGSPTGSAAWDTVEHAIWLLTYWEDTLREHLGHPDARARRPEYATVPVPFVNAGQPIRAAVIHDPGARRLMVDAVRYLTGHVTALLCAPFAVEAGHDILRLARQLERASGCDELVHKLPAPCLHCDRKALVRKDGGETVECRACRKRWGWDDYQRLAVVFGRAVREGAVSG